MINTAHVVAQLLIDAGVKISVMNTKELCELDTLIRKIRDREGEEFANDFDACARLFAVALEAAAHRAHELYLAAQ